MRAFIVLSCLAFAAARPEAGYSYQRPGSSGGGISSGLSGISGSSFGIGHGSSSFGNSFSSGGSSSFSGFGAGGVCSNIKSFQSIRLQIIIIKSRKEKKIHLNTSVGKESNEKFDQTKNLIRVRFNCIQFSNFFTHVWLYDIEIVQYQNKMQISWSKNRLPK